LGEANEYRLQGNFQRQENEAKRNTGPAAGKKSRTHAGMKIVCLGGTEVEKFGEKRGAQENEAAKEVEAESALGGTVFSRGRCLKKRKRY